MGRNRSRSEQVGDELMNARKLVDRAAAAFHSLADATFSQILEHASHGLPARGEKEVAAEVASSKETVAASTNRLFAILKNDLERRGNVIHRRLS
jgi:hypothetical protein